MGGGRRFCSYPEGPVKPSSWASLLQSLTSVAAEPAGEEGPLHGQRWHRMDPAQSGPRDLDGFCRTLPQCPITATPLPGSLPRWQPGSPKGSLYLQGCRPCVTDCRSLAGLAAAAEALFLLTGQRATCSPPKDELIVRSGFCAFLPLLWLPGQQRLAGYTYLI